MKSGFIAIVGRPNAGKSTLLNNLMKRKLAIISSKPQTTRNNISGILTDEEAQMIFVDTPGIHTPHHELGKAMNKNAFASLQDVDLLFYVVDASVSFGTGEEFVLNQIKNKTENVFLILNKVDLLAKEAVMKQILAWKSRYEFSEIFPLSANLSDMDELVACAKNYLPEGPMYFDEQQISDHDDNFLITELIREKILYLTEEEVPHSVAVVLESREESENKLLIQAMIVVERSTQKAILIGKGGSMISKITNQARRDLRLLFNKRVELECYVRVEENWRNNLHKLNQMGLGDQNE